MTQTWLREDIHYRLKVAAAINGQNVQEYLDELLPPVSSEDNTK